MVMIFLFYFKFICSSALLVKAERHQPLSRASARPSGGTVVRNDDAISAAAARLAAAESARTHHRTRSRRK